MADPYGMSFGERGRGGSPAANQQLMEQHMANVYADPGPSQAEVDRANRENAAYAATVRMRQNAEAAAAAAEAEAATTTSADAYRQRAEAEAARMGLTPTTAQRQAHMAEMARLGIVGADAYAIEQIRGRTSRREGRHRC